MLIGLVGVVLLFAPHRRAPTTVPAPVNPPPSEGPATIARVVARLGVADVRAFGLAWEDCEELLRALGYAACVEVVAA